MTSGIFLPDLTALSISFIHLSYSASTFSLTICFILLKHALSSPSFTILSHHLYFSFFCLIHQTLVRTIFLCIIIMSYPSFSCFTFQPHPPSSSVFKKTMLHNHASFVNLILLQNPVSSSSFWILFPPHPAFLSYLI